ncbi:E3 ubiquitin-protein ligase COP1 [Zancudomyces culisetae]|uniref:E3 ubiquitin-protein ligase COP1 n=1 Tax=Zancudomyces culisetae TaxID=1213189 RepID=A0A1R1PKX1_ZANCU|nr:E3 ubiquitin-protein ligase COP1 [Zancudomyces culisetae]|eukprot:OMH81620.1 E3 ubiquitin-protein ligase COP1 [Zancudomyces culisetae]
MCIQLIVTQLNPISNGKSASVMSGKEKYRADAVDISRAATFTKFDSLKRKRTGGSEENLIENDEVKVSKTEMYLEPDHTDIDTAKTSPTGTEYGGGKVASKNSSCISKPIIFEKSTDSNKREDESVDVNVDLESVKKEKMETKASPELGVEKYLKCPICLERIKEAFMTICGHTFCYVCIKDHLEFEDDCPCCHTEVSEEQLFPNFALNRITEDIEVFASMRDMKRNYIRSGEELIDNVEKILKSGFYLSKEHVECLLEIVGNKWREVDEKQGKRAQGSEFGTEVCRKRSTVTIVANRFDEYGPNSTDDCGVGLTDLQKKRIIDHFDDLKDLYFGTRGPPPALTSNRANLSNTLNRISKHTQFVPKATFRYGDNSLGSAIVASIEFDKDNEIFAVAGVTRKIKLYSYEKVLQDAEQWATITKYSKNRVSWLRKNQEILESNNHLSYTDEFYPFQSDINNDESAVSSQHESFNGYSTPKSGSSSADHSVISPISCSLTISNRFKISCLSYSPAKKSQLACSDYEGVVTLWDCRTGTSTAQYNEHEKRAWSVDFSTVAPTRLCSGGDDGRVKVWSTTSRSSVLTLEGKANVCSVRFSPSDSNLLAFGSADHNIHCYDLRQPKNPLYLLSGHKKAVSYVRFLSDNRVVSASTDNTLKLWDLASQTDLRTFVGHTNEKNFVGLAISSCGDDWISCGSENNVVYTYNSSLSKPVLTYNFDGLQPEDRSTRTTGPDKDNFVSAVCWKRDSDTMISANSTGLVRILKLC